MTRKRFIVELGTGADLHGEDVTEAACRAADEATRIFASYSYSMEYRPQRYYRDTRFLLYGGGTSEILQTIIAREVGLK